MGTETRVGILAGLVIVVVASVYFFYGSERPEDEILVTSPTRVSEPPRIPVAKDDAKPDTMANRSSPTANPAQTPPRRLAERLAVRSPQSRPPTQQPQQGPIVLADPSQPPASSPIPLRTGPSQELVEATWENLIKPGGEKPDDVSTARGSDSSLTGPTSDESRDASRPRPRNATELTSGVPSGRTARDTARLIPGRTGDSPSTGDDQPTSGLLSSRISRPTVNQPEPKTHIISEGDTLIALAQQYYGDSRKVELILAANPAVRNPRNLKIGQEIIIPAADASTDAARTAGSVPPKSASSRGDDARLTSNRTYTVEPGDTLYRIAQRVYGSGTRWEEILKHNRALLRGDPKRLAPGMVLQLP